MCQEKRVINHGTNQPMSLVFDLTSAGSRCWLPFWMTYRPWMLRISVQKISIGSGLTCKTNTNAVEEVLSWNWAASISDLNVSPTYRTGDAYTIMACIRHIACFGGGPVCCPTIIKFPMLVIIQPTSIMNQVGPLLIWCGENSAVKRSNMSSTRPTP